MDLYPLHTEFHLLFHLRLDAASGSLFLCFILIIIASELIAEWLICALFPCFFDDRWRSQLFLRFPSLFPAIVTSLELGKLRYEKQSPGGTGPLYSYESLPV